MGRRLLRLVIPSARRKPQASSSFLVLSRKIALDLLVSLISLGLSCRAFAPFCPAPIAGRALQAHGAPSRRRRQSRSLA
jgi:hypothetical protein